MLILYACRKLYGLPVSYICGPEQAAAMHQYEYVFFRQSGETFLRV